MNDLLKALSEKQYRAVLAHPLAAAAALTLKTQVGVSDRGNGTARLRISGAIDSMWGWDAGQAAADLDDVENLSELDVIISSPGGNVFEAVAFAEELLALRHDGVKITTTGRGVIASGAVDIFLTGEERALAKSTTVMTHSIRGGLSAFGPLSQITAAYEDVRAAMTETEAGRKKHYRGAGVDDVDGILSEDDNWMQADAALDAGIATEVTGSSDDEDNDAEANGKDKDKDAEAARQTLALAQTPGSEKDTEARDRNDSFDRLAAQRREEQFTQLAAMRQTMGGNP